MEPVALSELWLPILLSAAAVFVASSVIHMVLGYHKNDYLPVPNEDAAMDAVRQLSLAPGDYAAPRPASMADMSSPAYKAKAAKGPMFTLTVFPPGHDFMGKTLAQWFVYCLVISVFAAYLSSRALPRGAAYLDVSQIASTTAFAAYGLALWQNSIWYKRKWSTAIKSNIDSLIYGFLTGGFIGWLWPR